MPTAGGLFKKTSRDRAAVPCDPSASPAASQRPSKRVSWREAEAAAATAAVAALSRS